jgi:hypothetical protein
MVWITPYDNENNTQSKQIITPGVGILEFPLMGEGSSFASTKYVDQQTNWNIHLCASTVAPYNFYAWWTSSFDISGTVTSDTGYLLAPKTKNPWNHNLPDAGYPAALPFDGLGFLCMDSLINTNPLDTDPVVIWADTDTGAPCRSVGDYPQSSMSCNEGILRVNTNKCLNIRSWYKKPSSFSSNTDFLKKMNSYACAFLPTQVLQYTVAENWAPGGTYYPSSDKYPNVTVIPGNLGESIYSNKELVFPLMYGRGSTAYPQVGQYKYVGSPNAGSILKIKEVFKLPPAFKGTSNFIYLSGSTKNEFATLDYNGEFANYIYAGRYAMIVLPWDGSIPSVV